jgi:predicted outer membrane repeat protein
VYQDVNTDVTYGNMYFTQNVARNGGAVFLAQGATATFQVGSITRNRATVRFIQRFSLFFSCAAVDMFFCHSRWQRALRGNIIANVLFPFSLTLQASDPSYLLLSS